jgi:hypothetical protein
MGLTYLGQWENLINKSELLDKLVAEAATPK